MTTEDYEILCKGYKEMGYTEVGTKEHPYFITEPSEGLIDYFSSVFKATFGRYKK